jgi:RNA-directed DNA polymerase
VVTAVLDERGLALQLEQPRLVQRPEGVDVRGFHGQMRGQKLRITPQPQTVHARLQEVRSGLKTPQTVAAEVVIRHLTPLIRGWAMDDRQVVSQHPWQNVDDHRWRALGCWVTRRHPKQPTRWVSRRDVEGRTYGATCSTESRDRRGTTIRLRLERRPASPIIRPVQVKGRASLDDPVLHA